MYLYDNDWQRPFQNIPLPFLVFDAKHLKVMSNLATASLPP